MTLSEPIKKLLFFKVHVNKALPKDHLSRLGFHSINVLFKLLTVWILYHA